MGTKIQTKIGALLAALAIALVAVTPVLAGTFTLHPSGFGEHSYSAWKAQEGLVDSGGNANQALYFQKMTETTVFAAGVAVFKGFEGLPTSQLTGLEFKVRDDGWCGAGAPRFNITVQPTGGGPRQTFFVGCQAMVPTDSQSAPNGKVFTRRTMLSPFVGACCGAFPTFGFEVVSLAIVFDEGTTNMGLPYGLGFTFLDDITVMTNTGAHAWTSASDNGNGGDPIIAEPTGTDVVEELLGGSVLSLFP